MGFRALKNGLPYAERDGAIEEEEIFPVSLRGDQSQKARLTAGVKTRERGSQVPSPTGFAADFAGSLLLCRNPMANGVSCLASSKTKLLASGSASTCPKFLPPHKELPGSTLETATLARGDGVMTHQHL